MKERSLLYFITAVIASVLFLVSIVVRSFDWFSTYGYAVMPTMYALFIPVVILWVGWFFQNKGFLLSGSIVVAVLLGLQFNTAGILNGNIFVLGMYAPMVKTSFVLGVILMLATSGIGFYTYLKLSLPKQ
ncbi:MAG: hypothetical protein K9L02_02695 [Acholeplasmataceae bacterium]|nr:hypothetical protein [Acholeplasmataceae bacterium]